jgi:hypothetical protein
VTIWRARFERLDARTFQVETRVMEFAAATREEAETRAHLYGDQHGLCFLPNSLQRRAEITTLPSLADTTATERRGSA